MDCENKQAVFISKLDLSQFKYIKTLNDNRLGSIEIYQNKDSPDVYIMAKKKQLNSQEKFINELQKTQQRTELNHPNIMQMLDFKFKQINKESFEIRGFYDFPKWDLDREIKHRQTQNDYFSNQDLRKIMQNLIEALAFLQNKNLVHGDLRPKYITYSPNLNIQTKLIDRLADSLTPDQLQIRNLKKKNPLYVSPIVFETIVNQEKYLKHDPYKSEMFSLGLVLLQAALLKPVQQTYDYDQKKFNYDYLQSMNKQFLKRYGEDKWLSNCIALLISFDEAKRMNPLEFQTYLDNQDQKKFSSSSSKYDKQISHNKNSQENSQNSSKIEIQKHQQKQGYENESRIEKQDSDDNSQDEIPLYESNEQFDIANNVLIKKEQQQKGTNTLINDVSQTDKNFYQNNDKNQDKNGKQDKHQKNKQQIHLDNEKEDFTQNDPISYINQNVINTFSKDLEDSNRKIDEYSQGDFKIKDQKQYHVIDNQQSIDHLDNQQKDNKIRHRKKSVFDYPEDEYFSCRTIKNDSKEKIYIRKRRVKGGFSNRKNSVTRKTPPFDNQKCQQNQPVDNTLQRQYYHSPSNTKKENNRFNINNNLKCWVICTKRQQFYQVELSLKLKQNVKTIINNMYTM